MQAVRNYFSHFAKLDTWLKVGFQKSEITLDIPEDGEITRAGWKITPMTYPAVSLYFTEVVCEYFYEYTTVQVILFHLILHTCT